MSFYRRNNNVKIENPKRSNINEAIFGNAFSRNRQLWCARVAWRIKGAGIDTADCGKTVSEPGELRR